MAQRRAPASLPLAYTLGNPDATLDRGSKLQNGYAEKDENGLHAVKRPALDSAYTAATGQGQGLFTWDVPGQDPQLVVITDDTLKYGSSITTLTKSLRFVQNPTTPQNIATSFTPSVTVEAVSKAGRRVTGFTSNVTIAFSDNPTDSTLGGTLTRAAVAGLATFNNLTSTHSGEGFSLSANASSVRGDVSSTFNIPTHLVFTIQPGFANVDEPIVCAVTAQDTAGNTDTNFTGKVTVSLFSNPTGAILSGTLTTDAVAGVASFADLTVNIAGTYSLKAECSSDVTTSYKPASIISDSFNVGAYTLTAAHYTNTGIDATGFNDSLAFGAVSPTTFQGTTIMVMMDSTLSSPFPPSAGFAITLSGVHAQNFFTSVTINGVTLTTASASFSSITNTAWSWNTLLLSGVGTYSVVLA